MILDRLQYFLEHFWIDQKSTKYGPSGPVFITRILKKIQENYGNILEQYYLCKYGNHKCWKKMNNWKSYVLFFLNVEYLNFIKICEDEDRQMMKIG